MIEGNVGAKCRLTVTGFNDTFQDLDIYAGPTPRSGQRLVNAVAAETLEFICFSFDAGHTFVRGMAFEEFPALSGNYVRTVAFDTPKACI